MLYGSIIYFFCLKIYLVPSPSLHLYLHIVLACMCEYKKQWREMCKNDILKTQQSHNRRWSNQGNEIPWLTSLFFFILRIVYSIYLHINNNTNTQRQWYIDTNINCVSLLSSCVNQVNYSAAVGYKKLTRMSLFFRCGCQGFRGRYSWFCRKV